MAKKYATSAPLLGKIRSVGSTFFTVSSTLNDIDKTQMNSNVMMAPSRFVCLNLPDWQNQPDQQHFFEDPRHIGQPIQTDANIIVPKLIQNYIENGLALTSSERKDDSLQTLAEAFFWKLMRRTGALKTEITRHIEVNSTELPVFAEPEEYSEYKHLVVYASDINTLNHITRDGQSYTEIYMHVPTDATKLQTPEFIESQSISIKPTISGPSTEFTIGLEDHPNSNTSAIYDNELNQYTFNQIDKTGIWWDAIDAKKIEKSVSEDFEFNVVLVYYDIWYKDNPSSKKTNLYGILFLDKFGDSGYGSQRIETANKYAPNSVSTGNGYAIRLNIKTTSNQAQVTSEISLNDYNSVSMELYSTALHRINDITDKYESALSTITELTERLQKLEMLIPRVLKVIDK